MLALVRAQVDPLDRDLEEREQPGEQRVLVARQGEHAAVVVLVGLHVEHAQARASRASAATAASTTSGRRPSLMFGTDSIIRGMGLLVPQRVAGPKEPENP